MKLYVGRAAFFDPRALSGSSGMYVRVVGGMCSGSHLRRFSMKQVYTTHAGHVSGVRIRLIWPNIEAVRGKGNVWLQWVAPVMFFGEEECIIWYYEHTVYSVVLVVVGTWCGVRMA